MSHSGRLTALWALRVACHREPTRVTAATLLPGRIAISTQVLLGNANPAQRPPQEHLISRQTVPHLMKAAVAQALPTPAELYCSATSSHDAYAHWTQVPASSNESRKG